MATEFIGFNVLVTLKTPPNATIQGQVANVIGQRLILQNVTLSWTGQVLPTFSLDAPDIADLSLGPSKSSAPPAQHAPPPSETPKAPQAQPFVDPAILSFSKPPLNQPGTNESGGPVPPTAPSSQQAYPPQQQIRPGNVNLSAALSEPFSNLELDTGSRTAAAYSATQGNELDGSAPIDTRNRGGNKGKPRVDGGATSNTNLKSKGWRQTAFVEPADPQSRKERASQLNGRRRKKKGRQAYADDPNGWATEDPTDIQEMGEFDFQSNLSKFDKRRVFEEIRNDDTTADEDRLVSFNRKTPKPGTNNGKNLHWTENVLDSPQESETGDTEQEASDTKLSSGTYSGSRLGPTLKSSAILGQPLVPQQVNTLSRNQLNTSRTTSPMSGKNSISASQVNVPGGSGASLRLTTTNRSCPTVNPLQAFEVEQIAVAELGLTEDMITENAGRCIAEAAVGLLPNDSAAPTMLVLGGNHKTGARAISAARHLRNRGHRVTACMLGLQQESELLESCRKQLDVFKKVGGRVLRWEELSARLSSNDFEPDLVLDALFGMHMAFEDLRTDQQTTAFEMISWANRSNVDMLSVDIPSGFSAASGEVTLLETSRLCINSKSVVCLAAPKTGVMNALLSGEGQSWSISVADIGIPQVVWRKYGTRRRHGIDFGNRWVVPLRYQPPVA
ncbi:mRNA decapping enhancer EDC3 [Aspergillus glaucus CBS 516.65]|uniref:Enhancer of mRNA-decapping protein 3 n=1 Tax=Aspergillus glaucus CBS 516.65 TaxID=1160497 RepID=A0A1L9V8X3_ASPGL|nr:hypothetical protein ASPGLDRAFT_135028 [Aspergillus glaucus CBS 516.65]OJJ80360.1 hypothetical protein ASPGLDRAFT_135028 [Aspergillus glaucus CBS 516.65]